jgi:hypothetical protein
LLKAQLFRDQTKFSFSNNNRILYFSCCRKLQFLKRLVILVFHLTSLSLAVYFRPAEIDAELTNWPEEITDVARVIAECITILGVLGYIFLQLGGEIVNIGFFSFFKQLVRMLYRCKALLIYHSNDFSTFLELISDS